MWNHWIRTSLSAALLVLQGCSLVSTKYESVVTSVASSDASPELLERHRQSIEQMKAGQWEEAGAALEYMTEHHPRHAGLWLNLGIVQLKLGHSDAAEHAFRAAIDRNPGSPFAYNKLGILYRQGGRIDEALAMYQSALGVAPDHADTHWNIAILYELSLADNAHALQHYLRYQALTGSKDPQLQTWIDILKTRSATPA